MSLVARTIDGKKYLIEELGDGYVVAVSTPNGPSGRKAALTPAQVLACLKEFGLDVGAKDEVH